MTKNMCMPTSNNLGLKVITLSIVLLLLILCGCNDRKETTTKVSLYKTAPIEESTTDLTGKQPVKIAIAAILSPKETFISYKGILKYIQKKLDRPVNLVQRDTYETVNNLIRDEEITAAFVCSGAYVDGHKNFGMELLVAPVAYGDTLYYSYIIVPRSSSFQSLADLRGGTFAFPDPLSNSGTLSPTYLLSKMGETPDTFFRKTHFTYSHDKSIEAVASGIIDGAAVDSLVWDYLNSKDPVHTAKTRIINRSEPYGIPPVVVPKGLDPQLKKKLREIFLSMHEGAEGRKILGEIMIDRFVTVDDKLYDSVREMKQWLGTHGKCTQ